MSRREQVHTHINTRPYSCSWFSRENNRERKRSTQVLPIKTATHSLDLYRKLAVWRPRKKRRKGDEALVAVLSRGKCFESRMEGSSLALMGRKMFLGQLRLILTVFRRSLVNNVNKYLRALAMSFLCVRRQVGQDRTYKG